MNDIKLNGSASKFDGMSSTGSKNPGLESTLTVPGESPLKKARQESYNQMQSELSQLQDKIRGLEDKLQLGGSNDNPLESLVYPENTNPNPNPMPKRSNRSSGQFTFHNTDARDTIVESIDIKEGEELSRRTSPLRIKKSLRTQNKENINMEMLEQEEEDVLEESMQLGFKERPDSSEDESYEAI
jgi:hypothetical protein